MLIPSGSPGMASRALTKMFINTCSSGGSALIVEMPEEGRLQLDASPIIL